MKQKKKLNESVKVVKSDGTIEIYKSVKEAATATGLSEQSIKLRCNVKGAGSKSKDKIVCEWADEHTRRSKMAKRNKSKGNNCELQVIHQLQNIGYKNCVSSRSQNKLADANKIDIVDIDNSLPCNIQVKNTQNCPNYFEIRSSCTDKSKPFVIVWKKANIDIKDNTVAIIPIKYFYELIKKK